MLFDFQSFPLSLNVLVFLLAAGVTWFAGSKVATYADGIAARFHLGEAFAGLILLALATQLPEVATTLTASFYGNPSLAISNLFGSVITNAVLIAVLDFFVMRNALTFFTPKPSVALQGQLVIILLALTMGLMVVGEVFVIFHIGLWSFVIFLLYILGVVIARQYETHEDQHWKAVSMPDEEEQAQERQGRENQREREEKFVHETPTFKMIFSFAFGCLFILAAGYILSLTGDAIAEQTGLGSSFFGSVFLALATSLPELSTSATAMKIGNYSMAVSNLFGSNAILFALIFLNDIAFREGPILNNLTSSVMFSIAMGIVVMTIYLVGMTERKNRVILKMGVDSLTVFTFYIFSLVGLFFLSK